MTSKQVKFPKTSVINSSALIIRDEMTQRRKPNKISYHGEALNSPPIATMGEIACLEAPPVI